MKLKTKLQLGLGLLVQQTAVMAATPAKTDQRPNIVFIEVDDLNYEYLSCLGSKIVNTPNVDKLATNGVKFTNAFAQGMMSGPSRNSLITGMYPHNMGFYQNGDMKSLPDGVWTFPKALQRAGYYTSWVGKCHIRPFMATRDKTEAMRTQMGFDFVKQTAGRTVLGGGEYGEDTDNKKQKPEDPKKAERQQRNAEADWYMNYLSQMGLKEQFLSEFPEISTLPEDAYLDGFFSKTAEAFIREYNQAKPLFMWINYSVPHGPYDLAKEYHEPFDFRTMPGFTTTNFVHPPNLIQRTKSFRNEDDARREQAGIAASVSFMDRQVGRIISQLKEKGIYDNTIIVFFSDQGLMAGDHKLHHKNTLFRQITNPSLIISYPKAFQKDKTISSPVELRDLINTVLDISNAKQEDKSFWKTSYSLMPLLEGKSTSVRKYAFAEIEGYICISDGKYRYIEGVDAQLLFDDEKDPKNLCDIAAANPEIVKQLSAEIANWLAVTGKRLPAKSM
jgi:arylsulfatase A-like enzyme